MNRLLKRILIFLGLIVVVIVVAFGALFGPAFMGMKPIPEDFELDGMSLVQDGFTTAWVVPTGNGQVALVDAGVDPDGAAILEQLSRRGLGPESVVAVFLTHGHSDHTAAVPLFDNAEILALAAEADLIAGRVAPDSPLGTVVPASPTGIELTRALRDGEIVRIGGAEVGVYAVPGHTTGSAGYLVNRVLVLGDAGNVGDDDTVKGPPWIFSTDVAQARASLAQLGRRLQRDNVAVDAIAFAHSGPLLQGSAALLTPE
jgi:glyoxylase-like metal-dependent hydrolase (beta-lactamase superfamily II)